MEYGKEWVNLTSARTGTMYSTECTQPKCARFRQCGRGTTITGI
jgi:hypothetical protein